jgi:hypothetical protein
MYPKLKVYEFRLIKHNETMIRKTLFVAGALSTLVGCATSYHPNSFSGGYSESRLAPNVAMVSFRGNGFTNSIEVEKMALLRAAEVTSQGGYRFFVITGSEDNSTTVTVPIAGFANTSFGPGFANTTFMPGGFVPIRRPAVSFMIRMSNSQQELAGFRAQIYDANYLQASLKTS